MIMLRMSEMVQIRTSATEISSSLLCCTTITYCPKDKNEYSKIFWGLKVSLCSQKCNDMTDKISSEPVNFQKSLVQYNKYNSILTCLYALDM